jgi:acyl dehydratase
MPIDPEKLLAWKFDDVVLAYTQKDTILYALGLGFGSDPMDPRQLRFVYEKGLAAFPTMPVVLGYPAGWAADERLGIDRKLVVHGDQRLVLHRPVPVAATVRAANRIVEVLDKGKGKGALVSIERTLYDAGTGEHLATTVTGAFCRGDGGFAEKPAPSREPHPVPSGPAEKTVTLATSPQQALLYRLNGDWNPLHADPGFAAAAGFPRPILHGLCTYGIAARAVLEAFSEDGALSLRELDARFSAPVFPGDAIEVEMWRRGAEVSFRAHVRARGAKVLDNGRARLG